ncbi:TPA: hypothetical protein PXP51_001560 [Yersinia enterocolitica]|nr:hypothetical protein [Yersinia enterocolitica]HEN3478655.1 hypothetical protein [Yersinia enterocolitica]
MKRLIRKLIGYLGMDSERITLVSFLLTFICFSMLSGFGINNHYIVNAVRLISLVYFVLFGVYYIKSVGVSTLTSKVYDGNKSLIINTLHVTTILALALMMVLIYSIDFISTESILFSLLIPFWILCFLSLIFGLFVLYESGSLMVRIILKILLVISPFVYAFSSAFIYGDNNIYYGYSFEESKLIYYSLSVLFFVLVYSMISMFFLIVLAFYSGKGVNSYKNLSLPMLLGVVFVYSIFTLLTGRWQYVSAYVYYQLSSYEWSPEFICQREYGKLKSPEAKKTLYLRTDTDEYKVLTFRDKFSMNIKTLYCDANSPNGYILK